MQHRPGQSQVLGGDGDRRLPVAPAFYETSGPAAEAVLLVAKIGEDGARAHQSSKAWLGQAGEGLHSRPDPVLP